MKAVVQRSLHLLFAWLVLMGPAVAQSDTRATAKSKFDKLPAELQPTDPEVRSLLEQAWADSETGAFDPAISKVEKALAVSTAKGLIADRALAESWMGQVHFLKGQWKQAEQFRRQALQHAIESSNLVLEADILVTLAALPRMEGDLPKALSILSDALDRAKRSRNHLTQSRVLSEMGALQLAMGKPKEARPLLERALEIDEVNDFDSRPLHMVYLAQVTLAESPSSLDSAMQQLEKARDLAVEKGNYFGLVLSCAELGKIYLGKGQVDKGLLLLENMNAGKAPTGEIVIKNPAAYRATLALPLYRSIVLGHLAFAYRVAKQEDRALHTFSDLYAYAKDAGFVEFEAGAADEIARSNQALGNNEAAIAHFRIAADKLRSLKYEAQLERTLASLADLLMRSGQYDEAGRVSQEIVEIADGRNDAFYQFAARVDVARAHYQMKRFADAEKPLLGAELLIPALYADSNLDRKIVADQVLNLYLSQVGLYTDLKNPIEALIALEKAMLAAEDADNKEMKARIYPAVKQSLEAGQVSEAADHAYSENKLAAALTLYELVATFEASEARWNGRFDEWARTPHPATIRLAEIPFKLVAEPNGARDLEMNLAEMGRVAGFARIVGYDALMGYYLRESKPALAVEAGGKAFDLIQSQKPSVIHARILCHLAWAALLDGDEKLVKGTLALCTEYAHQFEKEDPKNLTVARILQSLVSPSSNPAEAQHAAEALVAEDPNDPVRYAQLARIYAVQGKALQAVAAWGKALGLYEKQADKGAVARAHLEIARLLVAESRQDFRAKLDHLQAALSLYQGTSDLIGQSDTNLEIGKFYASANGRGKAAKYLETSVRLARQVGKDAVTAPALSQAGDAYKAFDDFPRSLSLHTEAAELYRKLKDPAAESSELQSVAWVLDDLKRTDEALESAQKAKQLADSTSSWQAQHFSRRLLASLYQSRGDYDDPLRSIQLLKEAQRISDAAGQRKFSAWVGLQLTWDLAMLGEWEEALSQVNAALTTFRNLDDNEDSFRALSQLMMIYGDRRSDIKDFDKALQAYEGARKIAQADPSNDISSLSDSLAEVYLQMGRFDDAIKNAQESVVYERKQKDQVAEAHSLMSLAEAQREKGDLRAAAQTLSKAEPLVRKNPDLYTAGRLAYVQAGQARAEGHYKEAVELYERVVSLIENMKSVTGKEQQRGIAETYGFIYDELVATLHLLWMQDRDQKLGPYALKALQYSEVDRARAFSNSWGQIFVRELRKRIPAELQDRERAVVAKRERSRAELEQASATGSIESKKKAEEAVAGADREFDGLVQELRKTYPAYASVRFLQPIRFQQIPLRPGETLVEFKMTDEGTFVWIAEGTGAGLQVRWFYKVPQKRTWFDAHIVKIRDALNSGQPDRLATTDLEELFQNLFPAEPAKSLLSAKSLVIVLDGALSLIPIEMLSPSASQGEYPLLKTATRYYPSIGALMLARAGPSRPTWQAAFFGAGDPITSEESSPERSAGADSSKNPAHKPSTLEEELSRIRSRGFWLGRLPATAVEIHEISQLFPKSEKVEVRLGAQATKRQVLQTDLSRFRFIHFATHGLLPVNSTIMEPALVFSTDGEDPNRMLLWTSDVLGLDLQADNVTLSACNTGSGRVSRAEGVSSLGRAFMMAGASSVTVSLWQVNDASTAIFMKEYYRNLLAGRSKPEALAAARIMLRAKGYEDPFYWAPFILMGE